MQEISMTFREFDLNDCQLDTLLYYDGDGQDVASVKFCGNQLPKIMRSTGNVVIFQLLTNGTQSDSGFRLDYAAVDASAVSIYPITGGGKLTHCGLVTPYGDRDLGQHWLR